MKKLVTWTILAVLLSVAGTSTATSDVPFVSVSASPDELDLGAANFFAGVHEVRGAMTVDVEANCWHGPVYLSITPLKRPGGGLIEPADIFVRAPKMGQYVSLKKPVVVVPTSVGPRKVVLDFKVHAGVDNPAGHYTGVVTLTIVPPV
ncbi:MAG: hypothetical protein P8Z79_15015 [Sedimentisphaerales bacterium]|jgi:hypothetical protein